MCVCARARDVFCIVVIFVCWELVKSTSVTVALCEIWDLKLSLNLVNVFLEFSSFRSELTADIRIGSRAEKEVYKRLNFFFFFFSSEAGRRKSLVSTRNSNVCVL